MRRLRLGLGLRVGLAQDERLDRRLVRLGRPAVARGRLGLGLGQQHGLLLGLDHIGLGLGFGRRVVCGDGAGRLAAEPRHGLAGHLREPAEVRRRILAARLVALEQAERNAELLGELHLRHPGLEPRLGDPAADADELVAFERAVLLPSESHRGGS